MSQPIAIADIRHYVASHLETVFETMLSMKATAADAGELTGERVTGSVGMAGEKVTGLVYLHFSAPFAEQATAAMLGLPPEETPGQNDVNDVTGEVTNMIAGGLKSWLCDHRAACALTTPAIIRGTAFAITAKPDVECLRLGFECQGRRGLIEIHIKFN